MQWFRDLYKRIKDFFAVVFAEDIRNDYMDDGRPYHILSAERDFLQTSVKGDFRLHRLQNSFCALWRDQLVARSDDGTLRWRLEGWGRCMAVSPEKTQFVTVKGQQIGVFNAATGNPTSPPSDLDHYLDYLIWANNKRIIGAAGKWILVFDEDAKLLYKTDCLLEENGFISGCCADPAEPHVITLLDFNNQQIRKINLENEELIKMLPTDFAEQLFSSEDNRWIWTTVVNGTKLEEIQIYENKKLRERKGLPFKGKYGVRFANQSPDDISYHRWISLPSLCPNLQYFLVNDNSGLLWLIDAHTGDKRRIFSRYYLNYVYDTLWLDDEHFIALLEDGFVVKMNIRGKKAIFKHQDLDIKLQDNELH